MTGRERWLSDGTRAVLRRDGGVVYPRLDASVIHGGRRAQKAMARHERRVRPARETMVHATPNLPAWF